MEIQEKMLMITSKSDIKTDKRENAYLTVGVQELPEQVKNPVTGNIVTKLSTMFPKTTAFNQWEKSYLPTRNGAADPAFNLNVDDIISGAIVSREVEPYTFVDADGVEINATAYSTVVFGDSRNESAWNTAIFAAFRNADHPLEGDPMTEIDSVDAEEVSE